jgi:hypothetical protein
MPFCRRLVAPLPVEFTRFKAVSRSGFTQNIAQGLAAAMRQSGKPVDGSITSCSVMRKHPQVLRRQYGSHAAR